MRRLDTQPYQFALQDESYLRGLFDRALRDDPRMESPDLYAEALRAGVRRLVQRGKADGRQVETIIVALKEILGVSDRRIRSFRGDDDMPPAALLARQVVQWCIEEYYRDG